MTSKRQTFGIEKFDRHLGGGLLPGTLTVIAGATGAGKTQLGLRWADQGLHTPNEGRRGIICDLTSRGDAQNHAPYAQQQFNWALAQHRLSANLDLQDVLDQSRTLGDYFHPFERAGRRVTKRDLEPDDWHAWKTDLARILRGSAAYFYGNFVRGARRVIVDGIEPTNRFSDSIQFEFFEYLYHHIIRQQDDWAAREVLRESYRAHEDWVMAHRYDMQSIGCVYLYTSSHVLLDDLLEQPLTGGDIFSNANTIILMGRVKEQGRMARALYVAKHRGSRCGDDILNYHIGDHGLEFDKPL